MLLRNQVSSCLLIMVWVSIKAFSSDSISGSLARVRHWTLRGVMLRVCQDTVHTFSSENVLQCQKFSLPLIWMSDLCKMAITTSSFLQVIHIQRCFCQVCHCGKTNTPRRAVKFSRKKLLAEFASEGKTNRVTAMSTTYCRDRHDFLDFRHSSLQLPCAGMPSLWTWKHSIFGLLLSCSRWAAL